MTIQEFEQRTGFFPTQALYEAIEKAYMEFSGGKDAFCARYKRNTDGFAEHIQREVDQAVIKKEREQDRAISSRDAEIERLKTALEREQEWRPYEDEKNVQQMVYMVLAESVPGGVTRYLTDEEALDWICDEFGFDLSKVSILHEVAFEEINRHRFTRRNGKTFDRRPIYGATDFNYARFDVGDWQWEVLNGELRPFIS